MFVQHEGCVAFPKGFTATGISCSIKTSGEKDLGLIHSSKPCIAEAVFTQNKFKAAPVVVSQERIKNEINALIVNSGNANACTGKQGFTDAVRMTEIVEQHFDFPKESVLVASTGIISNNLPMSNVEFGVNKICKNLFKPHQNSDKYFAEAIMTTDKKKKTIALEMNIGGEVVRMGAAAKGAGMINPSMATMLAFVTTDAKISREALSKAMSLAVDETFNSITIDGDMSTNDSLYILANGMAGNNEIQVDTEDFSVFTKALIEVCTYMAQAIVKDGEGASKFITIDIEGAQTKEDATNIAFKISNSLLFKTACYGQDPNFGRALASAGSVLDANINPDKVDFYIGEHLVYKNGEVTIDECIDQVNSYMKKKSIYFKLDLNLGEHKKRVYTCDISFEYIRVNSAYKT